MITYGPQQLERQSLLPNRVCSGYSMKRLFYETQVFFGLRGQKPVKLVHPGLTWAKNGSNWSKTIKIGYFQHILDFSGTTRFFWSVEYCFQEESKPIILSYFLWNFIVRSSVYETEECKMLQIEPIS